MSDSTTDELDDLEKPKKKGMKLPVLIGIILGIIVVQAGIVMAAIKFFAPTAHEDPKAKHATEKKHSEDAEEDEHADGDEETDEDEQEKTKANLVQKVGGIAVSKSDLYINPKNGPNKIVVVSLGIEIEPKEMTKEVEDKLMVPIQDRVISRISTFTAEELQRTEVRDSLRLIIKNDIKPYFRGMREEVEGLKLRNVYFPKFVIQ
ncbi:MAG: flagellar basal body-associated FliL family protein [Candidatus Kapabacteria bacterium]|nr:flagellar basal body-associated FliL family protein [Candidatus Kapabacteria bacterium]